MARPDPAPKRVLRRLSAAARPGVGTGQRPAGAGRIARLGRRALARPARWLAAIGGWLAPFNPRARRRLRRATAAMMAVARELHETHAASGVLDVALVYRLEAANTALGHALAAVTRPGPPPDTDRTRMATALTQAVWLAQVAREWQQDIINLRHALAEETMPEAQQAALEGGVRHLQGYVQQNMYDFGRWLEAAARLGGDGKRAGGETGRETGNAKG